MVSPGSRCCLIDYVFFFLCSQRVVVCELPKVKVGNRTIHIRMCTQFSRLKQLLKSSQVFCNRCHSLFTPIPLPQGEENVVLLGPVHVLSGLRHFSRFKPPNKGNNKVQRPFSAPLHLIPPSKGCCLRGLKLIKRTATTSRNSVTCIASRGTRLVPTRVDVTILRGCPDSFGCKSCDSISIYFKLCHH